MVVLAEEWGQGRENICLEYIGILWRENSCFHVEGLLQYGNKLAPLNGAISSSALISAIRDETLNGGSN